MSVTSFDEQQSGMGMLLQGTPAERLLEVLSQFLQGKQPVGAAASAAPEAHLGSNHDPL